MVTVGTNAKASGAFRLLVDAEPLFGVLLLATALSRLVNAAPAFGDIDQALREPPAR